MDKVQFYYNPMSRGRIVHWMLEECGAPYEVHVLDFDKLEHKSPAYLKINPMGKIPAIAHRDTVVTESAAICAYLADAFPKAKLAPEILEPKRGTYYRWLFFGSGCIEPAIVDKSFKRPPVERVGANGYGTFEDTINALETALKPGPYILGDQFSAADVYICASLGWGMHMVKVIEPRPVFTDYIARCTDRPAYTRFLQQAEDFATKLRAKKS